MLEPAMSDQDVQYLYSPAYKVSADVSVAVGGPMGWDGFWRLIYDRMNERIQFQANQLLARGNITAQEAAAFVNSRNELLLRIRHRLSPFGQLYSEILKPQANLKGFQQFLNQKGSIEAVLSSVGKTRQIVDKIGVVSRVAGPATVMLSISATAVVIAQAPQDARAKVAAREIGGTTGSIVFGLGGMWAGCASAAALASPSLVLPVIGEVTTGGACLIGGIVVGLALGFAGQKLGSSIGSAVYTTVSEFKWSR
jgi:hypothetical protein